MAEQDDALAGFWFVGQRHYPQRAAEWTEAPEDPLFAALKTWLRGYFAAERPVPDFALRPRGTEFQKAVWDMLRQIPYGELTTYGALAGRMAGTGNPPSLSARAVGGAVGRNPISVLIPCHRVVGRTGKLTGYAGGLDKKEALLRLEGAIARGLS
jgi:methylated-DNA-[protein]-cysteine S-methyltransferase